MRMFLYIEFDENDADYRSTFSEITPETLEEIRPVINAIREETISRRCGDYNYLTGGRSEDGPEAEELYGSLPGWDKWNDYVPFYEYGFHTCSEIKIFHVESVENLLTNILN